MHLCGSKKNYNILISDLLDHSLDYYFFSCNCQFTLLTTLMLGDQMLSIIESIHNKNIIHRNIKPSNFLMGKGLRKHEVFISSFYLAKKYIDPKTKLHIPYKKGINVEDTSLYDSIHKLSGEEQSRRDDIEALGYILVYFLKGNLPWSEIKAKTKKEKIKKILEIKISNSLDNLCQGCPKEFIDFIKYARDLKFEKRPDYAYLKKIFQKISKNNNLHFDYNK